MGTCKLCARTFADREKSHLPFQQSCRVRRTEIKAWNLQRAKDLTGDPPNNELEHQTATGQGCTRTEHFLFKIAYILQENLGLKLCFQHESGLLVPLC